MFEELKIEQSLPLVSVIIRSLGRYTLREALDSITQQTYPAIEIIVVNALGKEHPQLPKQYGKIPLHLCSSGERLPRSCAANFGMEHAQGQYFIFLDDDDWFLPEHINALVNGLRQHPHAQVAYAGVQCLEFNNDGQSQCILVYNSPFDHIRILFENFIPIHAILFDRCLFDEGCRFDENLELYEDWDLWLQFRTKGSFIHIDQISAVYRIDTRNNLGSTANQGIISSGVHRIIQKWRDRWTSDEISKIFDYAKKGTAFNHWSQEKIEILNALSKAKEAEENFANQLDAEANTLNSKIAVLTSQLQEKDAQLKTVTENLHAIETSTIWRFSFPYRYVMNRLRSKSSKQKSHKPYQQKNIFDDKKKALNCKPSSHPVDIIVPVYKGLEETRQCLESLLQSSNQTSYTIIVINDASPELELVIYLDELAASEKILLLHNTNNIGFVLTCNRGMEQHSERDVVLLNSDTVVANNWLDRLQSCAYRESHIGTVTPFSNNATICSYPRFCEDNDLPYGYSVAQLDQLFQRANYGLAIDIPTAIGFCMYIRRDCLAKVGYFDTYHFGKGYGEENDLSLRAKALGWRNVLCADTFVYHAGGVSFADHKNERKNKALEKLNRIHPEYLPEVHKHIEQDPARPFRLRVDLARISESNLPKVLFIAGQPLANADDDVAQSLLNKAQIFTLHRQDDQLHVLTWFREGEAFQLFFRLPADHSDLFALLSGLKIARVYYHQMVGLHPLVYQLSEQLGQRDDVKQSLKELLSFADSYAYP